MSPSVHTRRNLLLGAVLGLLALAAGIALAERYLPEWRAGGATGGPGPLPGGKGWRPGGGAGEPTASGAAFRERYQELAARAGLTLEEGEPRVYLSTGS